MNYELERYAEAHGYIAMKDREDGRAYVVLWEYPDGTYHNDLPRWLVIDYHNEERE